MQASYHKIICIHPKDVTTTFLNPLGKFFDKQYHIIDDTDDAHNSAIESIRSFEKKSLIIFLGHGMSTALYSAQTPSFPKKPFIHTENAHIFSNHDVFLLACRSEEFIERISKGYNAIIGFGNIVSSREEILLEAEYNGGVFRNLRDEDINYFNQTYIESIISTFKLLFASKISFIEIPKYISYFLNKEINTILKDKTKENKIEVTRLLFEFRNEMKILFQ